MGRMGLIGLIGRMGRIGRMGLMKLSIGPQLLRIVFAALMAGLMAGANAQQLNVSRLKLTNGPKMDAELVASGIENMQIRVRASLSLITASYFKPTSATVWGNVNALEVNLLARSSLAEAGYKNADTIIMGDAAIKVSNDGFRRDVFTSVVFLRNN